MDNSLPIRKFLLKEIKAEHDRDHAEFEASVQEAIENFIDQNPKLMDLKVEAINKINITLRLENAPLKGVLLEYLEQEKSRIYKEFCSQAEKVIGRPVPLEEVEFLLTLPSSEMTKLERLWDKTRLEMVKKMRRCFLVFINNSIPKAQTARPDIQICLYLPDRRGGQRIVYVKSKGKVLIDKIIKPPTVTLDTNVVREWWEDRAKSEHVNRLLELGKKFQIDLAVTGRISDDIPEPPLAERINELPSINVGDIGSVIRFGHWKVGIDVAGSDEFKEFFDSSAVSKKLNRMNAERRPDWRDWDHLHTHYRYKRDYFLTWDSGILHFTDELKKELEIIVMKPDNFSVDQLPQSNH